MLGATHGNLLLRLRITGKVQCIFAQDQPPQCSRDFFIETTAMGSGAKGQLQGIRYTISIRLRRPQTGHLSSQQRISALGAPRRPLMPYVDSMGRKSSFLRAIFAGRNLPHFRHLGRNFHIANLGPVRSANKSLFLLHISCPATSCRLSRNLGDSFAFCSTGAEQELRFCGAKAGPFSFRASAGLVLALRLVRISH